MAGINRRAFAQAVALGAAASVPLTSPAEDKAQKQQKPPKEAETTSESEDPAPEAPPEWSWALGLILQRYPDERLNEEATLSVINDIRGDLARGRVLSRFDLANSDEPAFAFRAWRADEADTESK